MPPLMAANSCCINEGSNWSISPIGNSIKIKPMTVPVSPSFINRSATKWPAAWVLVSSSPRVSSKCWRSATVAAVY